MGKIGKLYRPHLIKIIKLSTQNRGPADPVQNRYLSDLMPFVQLHQLKKNPLPLLSTCVSVIKTTMLSEALPQKFW